MKFIYQIIRYIIEPILMIFTLLFWFMMVLFKKKKREKPRLLWGPDPLINNKYYSWALTQYGYTSKTLMSSFFDSINKKQDFDKYYLDFIPFEINNKILRKLLVKLFLPYVSFCYAIAKFDIFHHSFNGGYLGKTIFWKLEAFLLHKVGVKIVILGYGADFYRYSKIHNLSWTHGMLIHYPEMIQQESVIEKKVSYWTNFADAIINGMQIDHLGRWDALPFRAEVINTEEWTVSSKKKHFNGTNGPVTIVHAPNHRYIKGTEYLVHSVEKLVKEGLQIELILLEKKSNDEVKQALQQKADILFDQLIFGYAMFAIEGLASGLTVVSNLENEKYTRIFRRYSFLNECPIVSASHENLTDTLRTLVTNPELRQELNSAGRTYTEKYHSKKTANYLFGNIYEKIWFKNQVDTLNLYHPLISDYNKQSPIHHPLIENKIPLKYFKDEKAC